jgi:hypothetical protein
MMDQYRIKRFGDESGTQAPGESEYDMKRHKPLTKLSETTVQNIKSIEAEVKAGKKQSGPSVDIRDYLSDDQKRA